MIREIKFRVWEPFSNRMLYDPFSFRLRTMQDVVASEEQTTHVFEFDYDEYVDGIHRDGYVMQFTGLKDKNSKEIYEGDIVETNDGYYKKKYLHRIFWNHAYAAFHFEKIYPENSKLNQEDDLFRLLTKEPIVVGNIYQNSELLKQ